MKLTEKTKRRLTIAGLGVVSIVLVIAIASQFKTKVPKEPEILQTQAVSSEVTPSVDVPDSSMEPSETPKISVPSIDPTETPAVTGGVDTGKSTGTEQSIQAEPTKPPAPTEEPKTEVSTSKEENPTVNPSKTSENKTEGTVKTTPQEPAGGEKKDGKIYVPGFGWIEDEGGGVKQETVGNEGDELTGNKVGQMD
ncbi:DUF6550 family protein [Clostridium sp. KNHs205]|uniref:DUF6550 family protein n=1 Tax=Clostridium sp. KNHs205 TaxID=1449050 RepID=UPI00051C963D|nr:DUF6550 family protein [Clostridium sp. KNHs205]